MGDNDVSDLQSRIMKIKADINQTRAGLEAAKDEQTRTTLRGKIEALQFEVQDLRDQKTDMVLDRINKLASDHEAAIGEVAGKLGTETERLEKKMDEGGKAQEGTAQEMANEIAQLKALLAEYKQELNGAFRAIAKLRKDLDEATNEARKQNVILFGLKEDNIKHFFETKIFPHIRGMKGVIDEAFYLGLPKASPASIRLKTVTARDALVNLFFTESFKEDFKEELRGVSVAPSTTKYKRAGMTRMQAAGPLLRAVFKGVVIYRAYIKIKNRKLDAAAFASPSIFFEGKQFNVDAACKANKDFEPFVTGELNEFGDKVIGYKKKPVPRTTSTSQPQPNITTTTDALQGQPTVTSATSTSNTATTDSAGTRPSASVEKPRDKGDKGGGGKKKTEKPTALPSVSSGGVALFQGNNSHSGAGPSNIMGSGSDPYRAGEGGRFRSTKERKRLLERQREAAKKQQEDAKGKKSKKSNRNESDDDLTDVMESSDEDLLLSPFPPETPEEVDVE